MEIKIISAGSLKPFFDKLIPLYIEDSGQLQDIQIDYLGSIEGIRRVYQGEEADLIVVADYSLLDDLVIEGLINEYQLLTSNEMVICFTEKSKYALEINEFNWTEILIRNDVKTAHTNLHLDPAGYRALLVIKLAQKYYQKPALLENFLNNENRCIYNQASNMVQALLGYEVDYIFEYYSVAKNNNLNYLQLPSQINLADEQETLYKQVEVIIKNYKNEFEAKEGSYIAYGYGLLAREGQFRAKELASFMSSFKAKEILVANHFKLMNRL